MLHGKLVTLRPITPEDYPKLLRFKNDVEIELLGGGAPPSPTTLAALTEFFDKRVNDTDSFSFGIEADGVFIGDCGLFRLDKLAGTAEVGIGIGDREYWGRGYGREAMALLLDYGFRMQNLRKIWLETYGTNERALRSYRAVGFVEEGRQRAQVWSGGRFEDKVLMGLFRDDFTAPDSSSSGAR